MASFSDWINHRHRHSGIKFVTTQQRHISQAWRSVGIELSSRSRRASDTQASGHAKQLLPSTGGGLDQSSASGYLTKFSYVDEGCLNSSRASSFLGFTEVAWRPFAWMLMIHKST